MPFNKLQSMYCYPTLQSVCQPQYFYIIWCIYLIIWSSCNGNSLKFMTVLGWLATARSGAARFQGPFQAVTKVAPIPSPSQCPSYKSSFYPSFFSFSLFFFFPKPFSVPHYFPRNSHQITLSAFPSVILWAWDNKGTQLHPIWCQDKEG